MGLGASTCVTWSGMSQVLVPTRDLIKRGRLRGNRRKPHSQEILPCKIFWRQIPGFVVACHGMIFCHLPIEGPP